MADQRRHLRSPRARGAVRGRRLRPLVLGLLVAVAACAPAQGDTGVWSSLEPAASSPAPGASRSTGSAMPAGPCALPSPGVDPAESPEGPTDWSLYLRPAGVVKALMIFVDFPDAPAEEGTAAYHHRLVPEAVEWYAASSYGQLDLRVTPVHRWFRMPRRSADYHFADEFPARSDYISDAVAAADPHVDFRGYQALYIVAGDEAPIGEFSAASSEDAGMGFDADGTELRQVVTFGRYAREYETILNHETGHLFGLPDLYDTTAGESEDPEQTHPWVNNWDVMAGLGLLAVDHLAWHKWKLGWLNPRQVDCVRSRGTTRHLVTPVEVPDGVKMVVIRTGPTTALVAEVRRGPVLVGYAEDVPDRGVLIYAVDSTVLNGAGPVRVRDAHPDGDTDYPLDDALFDLGGGEVATYRDAASGVTVRLLARSTAGYTIEVVRP